MTEQIEKIVNRANSDLGSNSSRFTIPYCKWLELKLINAEKQLSIYGVVGQSEQLCECDDEDGNIPMFWVCTECNKEWKP